MEMELRRDLGWDRMELTEEVLPLFATEDARPVLLPTDTEGEAEVVTVTVDAVEVEVEAGLGEEGEDPGPDPRLPGPRVEREIDRPVPDRSPELHRQEDRRAPSRRRRDVVGKVGVV